MAQIQINIPDEYVVRVVDGICNAFNYSIYVESHPTVTKAQYAKMMLIKFIKRTVIDSEINTARALADSTSNSQVDVIDIT